MNCPNCQSTHVRENGHRSAKQNHVYLDCSRQFIDSYSPKGYPDAVKEHGLERYVNGLGFRARERCTGVNHNTVINWVKALGEVLPDAPESTEIPQIVQVDELETFVGSKNKIWLWTAVNAHCAGILARALGKRNASTFWQLWLVIRRWHCFLYITDGYCVYPCFIDDSDHLVSQTAMTRVESENSRLHHYLDRLHRKTFCYFKSATVLAASIKLLLHYFKFREIPLHYQIIS